MNQRISERYSGRVAFVTGGGAGIGKEVCLRLASEGASIAIVDYDENSAVEVSELINTTGGRAIAIAADVSNFDAMQLAVNQTIEAYGQLDVAVNNAGIGGPFAPLAEQELETWSRVIAVNLTGVFNSMKAQLPRMSEKGGAVINIASITSLVGVAGVSPYVAAKHGVLGLTRTAALEYGKYGVRVTAVCPTFIRTALTSSEFNTDSHWDEMDALHPLGHCAKTTDVAAVVAFLGSDDAKMITGCAYPVDGGITAA